MNVEVESNPSGENIFGSGMDGNKLFGRRRKVGRNGTFEDALAFGVALLHTGTIYLRPAVYNLCQLFCKICR